MSDYKRFTEFKPYRQDASKGRYIQYCVTGCYNDMNHKGDYTTGESVDRLAELEDKIEQGTLIELPCKVGDTVYEVFKDHIPPFIKETKIEKIVITAKGLRLRLARNSFYETAVSSIGKTIYFTREEAEKKLEELQNG